MNAASGDDQKPTSKGKKFLRYLVWMLSGVAGVVLALFVIGILVNLVDEKLKPEAQALLAPPSYHADPAANGYFILRAMDADAAQDAWKLGRETVDTEQRLFKENPNRQDYDKHITYKKAPKSGWNLGRCSDALQNCVKADLQHRPQIEEALAKDSLILRRYEAMQQLPAFEEIIMLSVAAPMASYLPLLHASDMATTRAVFEIADGNRHSGIGRLEQNNRYVRQLVSNASTLLGRMVSVNMLRKQTRAVSDLVEQYPDLVQTHGDVLAVLVKPLTPNQLAFGTVLANEARMLGGVFNSLTSQNLFSYVSLDAGTGSSNRLSDALAFLYFKRNATLNLFSDQWQAILDNASLPPAEYGKARARIQERVSQLTAPRGIPYLHYLSNPVGKILFEISSTSDGYVNYMERSADIDGYLRLVGLQIELRRNKVGADAAGAFVAQAQEPYRSPYDHAPMTWLAKEKQLQFMGHQKHNMNPKGGKVFVVQM